MSSLIIEDGTNVANANTFIDVEYLDSYATLRGLTVPIEDTDKEKFLVRAYDYLQFRLTECECEFSEIPDNLKKSQAQLVVEQQKRTPLFPKPISSSTEGLVTEKTVGPLTKKWAPDKRCVAPVGRPIIIASVEVFLKLVLKSDACRLGSGCGHTHTIRI